MCQLILLGRDKADRNSTSLQSFLLLLSTYNETLSLSKIMTSNFDKSKFIEMVPNSIGNITLSSSTIELYFTQLL